ncbi:EF-hand calcium-binding domain-containing protein 11 isoform X2 [Panthera tigris]|uniref:EF-hand calcium-binding domain-containing protein 11 isoform X2 n=1 Tax=Panthera leo TaxID=9689 RepID=UPI001C6A2380|nr:EF-hand calcium-binding domain-containing protein 11 isoform X2 [Panthera leo]XP_042846274.1 EF-hand calcium-binding domain-containing protein 11 isoform X2 [Panthera tigris]
MFFSEAGARPRTWEASPSEHKKWVKVFKACDEDNKGYLSREDFKVAVVMLFGYKPTKIEADSVMSSVNPNTSGLSLEEFLSIVRKKKEVQLHRNEIRHIFTAFDRHYRGYLTLEDFKKAFRQVAPKLSERTILEVFSLHPGDHALPGTSFSTGELGTEAFHLTCDLLHSGSSYM